MPLRSTMQPYWTTGATFAFLDMPSLWKSTFASHKRSHGAIVGRLSRVSRKTLVVGGSEKNIRMLICDSFWYINWKEGGEGTHRLPRTTFIEPVIQIPQ